MKKSIYKYIVIGCLGMSAALSSCLDDLDLKPY